MTIFKNIDRVSAFALGIATGCVAILYLAGPPASASVEQRIIVSDGWVKGPLKPKTYDWGAVVLKGDDPAQGFYFADFCGDHVMIDNGDRWVRIEADHVGYYNATLHLPIGR